MATIIYNIAILVGFFATGGAVSVLGYQQFTAGLDNAHKAILAVILFCFLFFAAVLIVH